MSQAFGIPVLEHITDIVEIRLPPPVTVCMLRQTCTANDFFLSAHQSRFWDIRVKCSRMKESQEGERGRAGGGGVSPRQSGALVLSD